MGPHPVRQGPVAMTATRLLTLATAVLLVIGLTVPTARAQSATHDRGRTLAAARAVGAIGIDGRLDEASWRLATPVGEFLQRDPDEGLPATEETRLRILYDDLALYVGVELFDREAYRIVGRLSRRDQGADADRFTLYLDPHHDHLTGAMFEVSAGNVQRDAMLSNDEREDDSWDGVWESAVAVDDRGWSLEMRIPFSQLRFPTAARHVFGLNAVRFIHRRNESSWLQLVPKRENGVASRMAHLDGIEGLQTRRPLEVLPYAVIRPEFVAPSSSRDPFNDGSRVFSGAGIDVKYGVTSSFVVDATINPDFGQVEVDPAVVNLGEFETTFPEKRPFFVAGSDIFGNFGHGGANSFFGFNRSEPLLFYSRRIGRPPQGLASGDFVDATSATTILGAAKLTGRTKDRWTVGVLEAVTGRETARVLSDGLQNRVVIEPATNYLVARIHKDVGERAGFGAIATRVNRNVAPSALGDALPRAATVVGGDGYFFFDDRREWVATGSVSRSWVVGSASSITRLQRAPQRYYQRPDAPHVELNPGATGLRGWAGSVNLNRNSGRYWTFNAALWGTSPGFDSSDAGLMFAGDTWGGHAVLVLRKLDPDKLTRSRSVVMAKSWVRNFDRQPTHDGVFVFGDATLLNYWRVGSRLALFRRVLDDRKTRGGPLTTNPGGGFTGVDVGTDGRRRLSASFSANYSWDEFGGRDPSGEVSITLKPTSAITISTGPSVSRSYVVAQYVGAVLDLAAASTFGTRYVFSDLDQATVSLVSRVNWIASPRMSLQVYAQPFIAVGDYWSLKELAAPRTFDFRRYGDGATGLAYSAFDRTYTLDPDGDGPAAAFDIADPSFNFTSLRVNAVFRWEWRLGSTLYVVWTENRAGHSTARRLALGREVRRLVSSPSDDILLVKLAYWFGR
jgi:hypothetical protein